MRKLVLIILSGCLLLVGCGYIGTGTVTASDILKENKDADILKINGRIYSNVTNLGWLNKENYSPEEKIGEIKKMEKSLLFFTNLSATKLPKGTILYNSDGGRTEVIIAKKENGENLYYYEELNLKE